MVLTMISQLLSPDHQLKNDAVSTAAAAPPLGQQTSIYSLTLDEFFNSMIHSSKDLGSMNMEEFLNSIFFSEESQSTSQLHHATMPPQPTFLQANNTWAGANHGGISQQPTLIERQGSLISLPTTLSRKTVDEVWEEIQRREQQHLQQNTDHTNLLNHHRQHRLTQVLRRYNRRSQGSTKVTCGEITMDEFLFKAEVVLSQALIEESSGGFASASNTQFDGGVGYSRQQQQQQQIDVAMEVAPVQLSSGGSIDREINRNKRKRNFDSPTEVVIERRQKRMIKNRESAARSRARKQAYTAELEAERDRLRAENASLKYEVDMMKAMQQQNYEEVKPKAKGGAQNYRGTGRKLPRSSSYP